MHDNHSNVIKSIHKKHIQFIDYKVMETYTERGVSYNIIKNILNYINYYTM